MVHWCAVGFIDKRASVAYLLTNENIIMSDNPNYRTLSGVTEASDFYLPASAHIHRSSVYRDSDSHKRGSSVFGSCKT